MAEAQIGELHVGFKGTMNALYLKDLPQKTHRDGRVRSGLSGGGICCGYDLVPGLGAMADGDWPEIEADVTYSMPVQQIRQWIVASSR